MFAGPLFRLLVVIATSLLVLPVKLFADGSRCDCAPAKKSGACTASIQNDKKWITIKSDARQCSMVVWYADEQPHITIVTDGQSVEEWLGQKLDPSLSIQSCEVCADKAYANQVSQHPAQPEHAGNTSDAFEVSGFWCTPGSREHWVFDSSGNGTIDGSSATVRWISSDVFAMKIYGATRNFTVVDKNTASYRAMLSTKKMTRC